MPEFIGERYDSRAARIVAVICLIVISFTYVAGQMRGVGIVFSRFLEVPIGVGLVVGMGVVFTYAVLGGMRGITYTQIAQYCVLIFAYTVPAVFIALQITGMPIPQIAFGSTVQGDSVSLLEKLDQVVTALGFPEYTSGTKGFFDVFCITVALMVGTAGLASCHRALLYRAQGARCPLLRWLGAALYRHPVSHRARRRLHGSAEPDGDDPDRPGRRPGQQPALRRAPRLVQDLGRGPGCWHSKTSTATGGSSTTTTRIRSSPPKPKRSAGTATSCRWTGTSSYWPI